ncbi:MAG: SUMF1/EgtB/PvdO family nonheme iron enzyme [Bacteroidales bacterium]
MERIKFLKSFGLLGIVLLIASCGAEHSPTTGWQYNDPESGGFEKFPFMEQITGPNLVMIEGGQFTMGRTEQDVMKDWDNIPRTVTVPSFYMDQTEVTNFAYLEYLYWLNRVFGARYPTIYAKALPDTNVWREKLGDRERYVNYYLRHPAYRDYPVVGVSWIQATNYAAWRTDRVNEMILVDWGLLEMTPDQTNMDHFDTDAYLAGQYDLGVVRDYLANLDPTGPDDRIARMEDGILLPEYRLPTEAEWEFAALGLIGNTIYERIVERRKYPWNGHVTRTDAKDSYGDFVANFRRGRGDYMGVAGDLNDAGGISTPVYAYWPNDYGLYNMAGNVSEWVRDVYRPLSLEDMNDFAPFRGNVYKVKAQSSFGGLKPKLGFIVWNYSKIVDYLNEVVELSTEKLDDINMHERILVNYLQQFAMKADTLASEDRHEDASILMEDGMLDFTGKTIRLNTDQSDAVEDVMGVNIDSDYDEMQVRDEMVALIRMGVAQFIEEKPGEIQTRAVKVQENLDRRNYRKADNINYLDGSYTTRPGERTAWEGGAVADPDQSYTDEMYDYPEGQDMGSSLIDDQARVYKGASWKDGAYWLSPGTRRFLTETQRSSTIGFRCAMDRVGSPVGHE